MHYHIQQGHTPSLSITENTVTFTHTEGTFPEDAYHLAGAICRATLLKQGRYSAHAACINGHLLVGHSGAGKTTLLLKLMAHWPNVIATNKTVLNCTNTLTAIGGTTTITLNATDMCTPCPPQAEHYGSRVALPRPISTQESQPIQAIWLLQLSDRPLHVQQLSPLSSAHKLYPFIMDKVNADILLCGGKLLFHEEDASAAAQLARKLPQALQDIPVCTISGSAEQIANHIKGTHT